EARRADVLASIIKTSDDAIFSKTLDGTITSWNAGAERLYGYAAPEVLGRSVSLLIPPGQAGELDSILERLRRGEHVDHYETERVRKDGSRVNVSLTVSPVEGEGGRVVGASVIARDITGRLRAEAERARLLGQERRLRAEAEEASRLKDEFLATVSHELRTPLTAIQGWALLLNSGQLDDAAARRAAAVIERNARAQKQIINDLLDVSRFISGKMRLEVERVALGRVVAEAVEAVRLAAQAKGIEIEGPGADQPDVHVSGDPDRLQQIVWNLLTNAVKFTPQGGRVAVALTERDGHAEISVSDTGCGIAPDFLPYVFDRFRQADGSTTREHGGLGLGLAIVRHLVELHGGTVRAESEGSGSGCVFTVRLPLLRDAERGLRIDEGKDGGRIDEGYEIRNPSPAFLSGLRVLVVDDDAETLALLRTMLAGRGAEVSAASSAGEALAALERDGADVLVSDIGMPGGDGYELIRRVRAGEAAAGLPAARRVPALALTAYARAEDSVRALAEGFQAHLAKPVEPAELWRAVARLGRGLGV
ncbi:MAG TPA: ATP-binding protein, partial [Pyrinomonadaceae bacterium]|nr:ATP-binding protein [Pyrinomonadaceae bacterium]